MFKKVLVTFTVSVLISNMQNSLTAILYHLIQTSVKTKKKKRDPSFGYALQQIILHKR